MARELSCFICRELLYEYQIQSLDARRADAVDRHIQDCANCKEELKKYELAENYLSELSRSKVSVQLIKDLQDSMNTAQGIRQRLNWKRWPESARWAVESLGAAALVALLFNFGTKWATQTSTKPDDQSVVLAEVEAQKTLPHAADEEDEDETEIPQEIVDEHTDDIGEHVDIEPEAESESDTQSETVAEADSSQKAATEASINEGPFVPPKIPLVLARSRIAVNAKGELARITTLSTPVPTPTKGNAFVYRMYLFVPDPDIITPLIKEKIEDLGGEKAGEVALGWKRGSGSYFHFTVPEKNFQELLNHLKSFAPLRSSRDPHRRVMPEGTFRVILWVENQGKPQPHNQEQEENIATPGETDNATNTTPPPATLSPSRPEGPPSTTQPTATAPPALDETPEGVNE